MAVKPIDLSLESSRLRDLYSQREIDETIRLIKSYGSVEAYASNYEMGDTETDSTNSADMDVFSSEYLSGMASNILPSAQNTATGIFNMITSPVESAKAIYEAGPSGIMSGMADRYGTPSQWAGGDFSNIKQTLHDDPTGLALEALPGVGVAGKVASQVGLKTGAITARTAAQISKLSNTIGNPVETLAKNTAIRGGKFLSEKIGTVGLTMLDFTTGMPVQSLKAMYAAGRLSGKQRAVAGTSFYKNMFGEFEVGDSINPGNHAKLRNGEIPDDITIDTVLEHNTMIFDELDKQTPYRLFRDAQKDMGGFQDEARIFGHIQALEKRYDKHIELNAENITSALKSDLGSSPGAMSSLNINIKKNLVADLEKAGIKVQNLRDDMMPIDGDSVAFARSVGFRIDGNTGFSDFESYLLDFLNADLTNPNVLSGYLTGKPGIGTATKAQQNLGFYSMQAFKTHFSDAPSPMSTISDNLYTSVRKSLDESMKSVVASPLVVQKRAALNRILDTQADLYDRNNRLFNDFAAYRTGNKSKDAAIKAWVNAVDNDAMKKGFIDEVEAITGDALSAPIAGMIARRISPKSLVARGSAVSAGQAVIRSASVGGAVATANPAMLLFIPFTSPKMVGTILSTFGLKQRFGDYLTAVSRAMHQHPIGKTLGDSPNFIFSMYTALDHIQRYNQQQKEQ